MFYNFLTGYLTTHDLCDARLFLYWRNEQINNPDLNDDKVRLELNHVKGLSTSHKADQKATASPGGDLCISELLFKMRTSQCYFLFSCHAFQLTFDLLDRVL